MTAPRGDGGAVASEAEVEAARNKWFSLNPGRPMPERTVRRMLDAAAAARPAPAGEAALRQEICVLVDAAEVQQARFRRLLVAFHDATRRPLGVTPDSGEEFYDWRMAEVAEEVRPRHGTEPERRERPEVRLVAAQREKAAALGLLDGHASVVRQLEREKATAEAALAQARAVLRQVEWVDIPTHPIPGFCPSCWRYRGRGHAPGCALGAQITATRVQVRNPINGDHHVLDTETGVTVETRRDGLAPGVPVVIPPADGDRHG